VSGARGTGSPRVRRRGSAGTGRASAWTWVMAAPLRGLHPFELLAQVVNRLPDRETTLGPPLADPVRRLLAEPLGGGVQLVAQRQEGLNSSRDGWDGRPRRRPGA